MEYDARSSGLSSLEPAHARATDPERSPAGQEGWRPRPDKAGMGAALRDSRSTLAFALPDGLSTKPCHANEPETRGIIAPTVGPAALSSIAKRDLKSAIRRTIGTWMGCDLTITPADIPWLRKQMADWTAAR